VMSGPRRSRLHLQSAIDKPAGAAIHRSFRGAPIRKGVGMANMSHMRAEPAE